MNIEDMTILELLAIVLKSTPDDEMVRELVNKYSSTRSLYRAPLEELTRVKGIGIRKARMLKTILELGLRLATPAIENKVNISSPREAYEYLKVKMPLLDREHFVVIALNTKNRVLSIKTISIGSLNSSIVHPREVFSNAIKIGASSIILVHNHPSLDPTPSKEDIRVTKRLVEVGEIVGIKVLDHIIIGDSYVSLRERGLM